MSNESGASGIVALIGYPLGHSLSPVFQQAAFDQIGLAVRYEAWPTPPEQVAERVARLRTPGHLGMNITVPHKQAVMPLLDQIAPAAARIGAVNTIVVEPAKDGAQLRGENTDAPGFLRALRQSGGFDPVARSALLLGAGGAARAVAVALLDAGAAEVRVANRGPERARALAADLADPRLRAVAWPALDSGLGVDLVVNCTTLGMAGGPAPGASPVSSVSLVGCQLACDLVYTPADTPFLRAARAVAVPTLGGLPMLIYQGAIAFERWTGLAAPVGVMFAAARGALIGRGSGS